MEIENYRVLCSQLEAQISMMHDKGSAKGAAGALGEQRERSVADGSLSKVMSALCRKASFLVAPLAGCWCFAGEWA